MTVETKWTDDMLAELRRHFDAGTGGLRIAEALGISRGAVLGKIHRLGWERGQVFPETRWTDELVAELRTYFDKGLTDRAIGGKMGLSKGTISGKLARMKWVRPPSAPQAPRPAAPRPAAPRHRPAAQPAARSVPALPVGSPCLWPSWTMKDDAYWSLIAAGVPPRCGKPSTVRYDDFGRPVACQYCLEHAARAFQASDQFVRRLRAA